MGVGSLMVAKGKGEREKEDSWSTNGHKGPTLGGFADLQLYDIRFIHVGGWRDQLTKDTGQTNRFQGTVFENVCNNLLRA